ncbi:MAG: M50 family metallopeptidase, partial [Victivallaceae bacterium]
SARYLFGELFFNGENAMDFEVNRNGEMVEIKNVQPKLEPLPQEVESYFNRYITGISYSLDDFVLMEVIPASPAEKSGLREGDKLLKLNNTSITNAEFIQKTIQDSAGKPVEITVLRDNKELVFSITPKQRKNYDLGIQTAVKEYPSPFRQFANTAVMSYKSLRALLVNLGSTLKVTDKTSTVGIRNMSGPIGMGTVIFKMSYSGNMMQVISFTVMITFALAIFNLFPLPVLDGGHITLGFIEIIMRRPLPTGLVKVLNNVFIVLLISLMVAVSYFDFTRLLPVSPKQPDKPADKVEAVETDAEADRSSMSVTIDDNASTAPQAEDSAKKADSAAENSGAAAEK